MHRITNSIILLPVLLVLVHTYNYAQTADSTHHIQYTGMGSLNRTNNSSTYLLNNIFQYGYRQKKIQFNSANAWIYGQQKRQVTNNDFSSTADFDFNKDITKLYYWGLLNYQTSYSLKINYQFQSGAGVGYTFIKNSINKLNVSDGFLYEANDLTDAVIGRDMYNTVRNSFRLKYRFVVAKMIILDGTDFVQPSLLSISDYILKFNNNFSVNLKRWLSLTTSVTYNKISRTNSENLLVTFGIKTDAYF